MAHSGPSIIFIIVIDVIIVMEIATGKMCLGTRAFVTAFASVMVANLFFEESHTVRSSDFPFFGRRIISSPHRASKSRRRWYGRFRYNFRFPASTAIAGIIVGVLDDLDLLET